MADTDAPAPTPATPSPKPVSRSRYNVQGMIIFTFCFVVVTASLVFGLGSILKIDGCETNLKDLYLMAGSAIAGYLTHKAETADGKPSGE